MIIYIAEIFFFLGKNTRLNQVLLRTYENQSFSPCVELAMGLAQQCMSAV